MIRNLTQKSVISKQEKRAVGIFLWMRGLMFRRRQNLVMIFPISRRVSLHMWFVFFEIDVLMVDEHKKVVEIKRDFRPWTTWQSSTKGRYVIELGIKSKYELGDVLQF